MFDGKIMRDKRHKMNLTIKDVADKIGLTTAAVSRYELNQRIPTFETLQKISEILDTSVAELLQMAPIPQKIEEWQSWDGEHEIDGESAETTALISYMNALGYMAYPAQDDTTKIEIYDQREDITYLCEPEKFNHLRVIVTSLTKYEIDKFLREQEIIDDEKQN